MHVSYNLLDGLQDMYTRNMVNGAIIKLKFKPLKASKPIKGGMDSQCTY